MLDWKQSQVKQTAGAEHQKWGAMQLEAETNLTRGTRNLVVELSSSKLWPRMPAATHHPEIANYLQPTYRRW